MDGMTCMHGVRGISWSSLRQTAAERQSAPGIERAQLSTPDAGRLSLAPSLNLPRAI